MSWVSDITGGVGDAVSSLVSGVESMFGGGGSSGSASSDAAPSPAPSIGSDVLSAATDSLAGNPSTAPEIANFQPTPVDATAPQINPVDPQWASPAKSATDWGNYSSPVFQGALATGALRLLGGALAPNPMAMQINAQDAWTQKAIARAKENQNVDRVVIPHVAPATPRKGLIGTNIGN
jgi:hypothetical protein